MEEVSDERLRELIALHYGKKPEAQVEQERQAERVPRVYDPLVRDDAKALQEGYDRRSQIRRGFAQVGLRIMDFWSFGKAW